MGGSSSMVDDTSFTWRNTNTWQCAWVAQLVRALLLQSRGREIVPPPRYEMRITKKRKKKKAKYFHGVGRETPFPDYELDWPRLMAKVNKKGPTQPHMAQYRAR